ncbi:hypothetical protein DIPPA_15058 [Diplonema papillatum]|nr:hypothetical protein DIPPA_15058 [Diplonema papillatum]
MPGTHCARALIAGCVLLTACAQGADPFIPKCGSSKLVSGETLSAAYELGKIGLDDAIRWSVVFPVDGSNVTYAGVGVRSMMNRSLCMEELDVALFDSKGGLSDYGVSVGVNTLVEDSIGRQDLQLESFTVSAQSGQIVFTRLMATGDPGDYQLIEDEGVNIAIATGFGSVTAGDQAKHTHEESFNQLLRCETVSPSSGPDTAPIPATNPPSRPPRTAPPTPVPGTRQPAVPSSPSPPPPTTPPPTPSPTTDAPVDTLAPSYSDCVEELLYESASDEVTIRYRLELSSIVLRVAFPSRYDFCAVRLSDTVWGADGTVDIVVVHKNRSTDGGVSDGHTPGGGVPGRDTESQDWALHGSPADSGVLVTVAVFRTLAAPTAGEDYPFSAGGAPVLVTHDLGRYPQAPASFWTALSEFPPEQPAAVRCAQPATAAPTPSPATPRPGTALPTFLYTCPPVHVEFPAVRDPVFAASYQLGSAGGVAGAMFRLTFPTIPDAASFAGLALKKAGGGAPGWAGFDLVLVDDDWSGTHPQAWDYGLFGGGAFAWPERDAQQDCALYTHRNSLDGTTTVTFFRALDTMDPHDTPLGVESAYTLALLHGYGAAAAPGDLIVEDAEYLADLFLRCPSPEPSTASPPAVTNTPSTATPLSNSTLAWTSDCRSNVIPFTGPHGAVVWYTLGYLNETLPAIKLDMSYPVRSDPQPTYLGIGFRSHLETSRMEGYDIFLFDSLFQASDTAISMGMLRPEIDPSQDYFVLSRGLEPSTAAGQEGVVRVSVARPLDTGDAGDYLLAANAMVNVGVATGVGSVLHNFLPHYSARESVLHRFVCTVDIGTPCLNGDCDPPETEEGVDGAPARGGEAALPPAAWVGVGVAAAAAFAVASVSFVRVHWPGRSAVTTLDDVIGQLHSSDPPSTSPKAGPDPLGLSMYHSWVPQTSGPSASIRGPFLHI